MSDPRRLDTQLLVERLEPGVWLAGDVTPGAPGTIVETSPLPDAAAVEAFLEALRTRLRLRHPGLDRVVTFGRGPGEGGDEGWVAVADPPGITLEALLAVAATAGLVLPVEVVVAIGERACRALHHVHGCLDARGQPLGLALGGVGSDRIVIGADGEVRLRTRGVATGGRVGDVVALLATLRAALASPAVEAGVSDEVEAILAGRTVPTAQAVGAALHTAALGRLDPIVLREAIAGVVGRVGGAEITRRADLRRAAVHAARVEVATGRAAREAVVTSRLRRGRLVGMIGVGVVAGVVLALAGAQRGDVEAPWPTVAIASVGGLGVDATPAARIVVDGVARGAGEHVDLADIVPGTHRLRVEADRHVAWSGPVRVVAGAVTRVERALEAIPDVPPARLVVDSRPRGASVLVDGQQVGRTPLSWSTDRVGRDVVVTIRKVGFADVRQPTRLESGRAAQLGAVVLHPAAGGQP